MLLVGYCMGWGVEEHRRGASCLVFSVLSPFELMFIDAQVGIGWKSCPHKFANLPGTRLVDGVSTGRTEEGRMTEHVVVDTISHVLYM